MRRFVVLVVATILYRYGTGTVVQYGTVPVPHLTVCLYYMIKDYMKNDNPYSIQHNMYVQTFASIPCPGTIPRYGTSMVRVQCCVSKYVINTLYQIIRSRTCRKRRLKTTQKTPNLKKPPKNHPISPNLVTSDSSSDARERETAGERDRLIERERE